MKPNRRNTQNLTASAWSKDDGGAASVLSLFFVLIVLMVGGLAIDFNKAVSERTQLQITPDTAAHAALYTRETKDEQTAKTEALTTVFTMLPEKKFGTKALLETDISFGKWDRGTASFVSDFTSKTAVHVRTQMNDARCNASRNYLLKLVGLNTIDISAESICST